MFIWNQRADQGKSLPEELLNAHSVHRVRIATAFFSAKGLALLQRMKERYQLERENIVLYLSSEFSMDQPDQLLAALTEICETRISFRRMFHPKVYDLQGEEDKLIFGSANFTGGGMADNVEFISVLHPNQQQKEEVHSFFAYCDTISLPVDEEMIRFYEENGSAFAAFQSEQKAMKRRLSGYIKQEVSALQTAGVRQPRKADQEKLIAACSTALLIAATLPSPKICSRPQASAAAVCPSTCKTVKK